MVGPWCVVLLLISVGNFLTARIGDQLLVSLLSMFILPYPVGASTARPGRVLLAALTPLFSILLLGTVGRAILDPLKLPGIPAEWGWLCALMLVLPVAMSNALCAPPYRLSILSLQSLWVWYFTALFVSRGQVQIPEALAIALGGPCVFIAMALLGRLLPAQGQEHLKQCP